MGNCRTLILAVILAHASSVGAAAEPERPSALKARMVDMGGYRLQASLGGHEHRARGQPAIVFANGLGATLNDWQHVAPRVAQFAQVVLYDRPGLGGSEQGPALTLQHVVEELHALLEKLDVRPPYILVGHSFGGLFIRAYAGTYPSEVAGMVYVDPTDFMMTRTDMQRILTQSGGGPDAWKQLDELNASIFAPLPPAIQAEGREARRLEESDYADVRKLPPAPEVPVFILAAGKHRSLPAGLKFPVNFDAFNDASLQKRLEHYLQWTRQSPQATLIFTMSSGHGMPYDVPDLIVTTIERAYRHGWTRLRGCQ